MIVENLIRQNIKTLKPYSSARSLFSGDDALLLDANENGTDLFGNQLNRYPDPMQVKLKARIASLKNLSPSSIYLGNGSDEAIDLLMRIFCEPKQDEIIICPPTYGMYEVQAQIHNTYVKRVPLTSDFNLRPEKVLVQATENSKLLFLCCPNNPTGNILESRAIEKVLNNFPGIVVIDEAYGDFCTEPSWSVRVSEFPNLVVLQTLSKAWGLAGARLGIAIAQTDIIHWLNAVKYPYNISTLNQITSLNALQVPELMKVSVSVILEQREWLTEKLGALNNVEKVYPSDANFLLVKFRDSNSVFTELKNHKIIVRDRSNEPGCSQCLRITVGTKQQNLQMLHILEKMNTQ
jgi:histidinol-phosphate aminotransferase